MVEMSPKARPRYGEGKAALLKAVTRIVARAGLRGLTYRAVAQEAGVSHGSVTLHFGSRDAMIEEAHAQAVASAIMRSAVEPGTGELSDFVAGLAQSIEDDPESELFQYELSLESRRRPDLGPQTRRLYDGYTDAVSRELQRIGLRDDPVLARFIAGALDGVAFQQSVGLRTRQETEEELDILREMLGALLVARTTPAAAQDEISHAASG